jgi:hypothetical protein
VRHAVLSLSTGVIAIHPHIRLVCFNGIEPARLYGRYVLQTLDDSQRAIGSAALPSTSRANTGLTFPEKAARWTALFGDAALNTAGVRVIDQSGRA